MFIIKSIEKNNNLWFDKIVKIAKQIASVRL
jgi:hypothetical protein